MHCFLWKELSFRYAGASADAPAYHFYREGFCSNRSVMLHNLSTLGISLRSMTDLLEQKSSL